MSETNLITVGILTVSDRCSRGEQEDQSGPALKTFIERKGWVVCVEKIIPDEVEEIRAAIINFVDAQRLDVVLTTGGTGLGPRDVTPEATRDVIDKEIPGLAELMRNEGRKLNFFSSLSRAVVGVRKKSLVINVPGSPRGAVEALVVVIPQIPHALQMLAGHGHPQQDPCHVHRS